MKDKQENKREEYERKTTKSTQERKRSTLIKASGCKHWWKHPLWVSILIDQWWAASMAEASSVPIVTLCSDPPPPLCIPLLHAMQEVQWWRMPCHTLQRGTLTYFLTRPGNTPGRRKREREERGRKRGGWMKERVTKRWRGGWRWDGEKRGERERRRNNGDAVERRKQDEWVREWGGRKKIEGQIQRQGERRGGEGIEERKRGVDSWTANLSNEGVKKPVHLKMGLWDSESN